MARGHEQPPPWARHALGDPESGVIQLLVATHFFGQSWAGPGDDAMCCAQGCWVGGDQAGRILRDLLRVGSLESKRAERPNVL